MIILDTNVVSEFVKIAPSADVRLWARTQFAADLFTTSVTQAEMLLGVALMDDGRKKLALGERIARIFLDDFPNRILPFDSVAAQMLAPIATARRASGRPVSLPDLQIAAIVRAQDATLATRNVRDFEDCGIAVVNPWSPS
jgi:predicted nucleic acid-binding protein